MTRTAHHHTDTDHLLPWLWLLAAISLMLLVAWWLALAPGTSARSDGAMAEAQRFAEGVKQISVPPADAKTIAGKSKDPRLLLDQSGNASEIKDNRVIRIGSAIPAFVAGADTSGATMEEKNAYEYREVVAALNRLMHAVNGGREDMAYAVGAFADAFLLKGQAAKSAGA